VPEKGAYFMPGYKQRSGHNVIIAPTNKPSAIAPDFLLPNCVVVLAWREPSCVLRLVWQQKSSALFTQGLLVEAIKKTWKSGNTKVAKVDANGKVTAVGKGSTTITFTAFNGQTKSCKVTVK